MKYFNELMSHIAEFLKGLLERFLQVLGFVDSTKNDLDKASEAQSNAAAE